MAEGPRYYYKIDAPERCMPEWHMFRPNHLLCQLKTILDSQLIRVRAWRRSNPQKQITYRRCIAGVSQVSRRCLGAGVGVS